MRCYEAGNDELSGLNNVEQNAEKRRSPYLIEGNGRQKIVVNLTEEQKTIVRRDSLYSHIATLE